MRDVFARVPGAFTWDGHDIRDGRSLQPKEVEESPCYEAVERVASECFEAFQLGGRLLTAKGGEEATGGSDGRPERGGPLYLEDGHYLQHLCFEEKRAELDVAILDIRSRRSRYRVLWAAMDGFREASRKPPRLQGPWRGAAPDCRILDARSCTSAFTPTMSREMRAGLTATSSTSGSTETAAASGSA